MKKYWSIGAIAVVLGFTVGLGASPASATPVPTLAPWAAIDDPGSFMKRLAIDSTGTVYAAGTLKGSKLSKGAVLNAVTASGTVITDLARSYDTESGSVGVVVDASRVVTVCNQDDDPTFIRVDRGRLDSTFPTLGFWNIRGCEIDASGNVYTALPWAHSVVKANASGLSATNMLASPESLVVAPDGTRYTYNSDNTISVASPTATVGSTLAVLPTVSSTQDGEITRDDLGNLYVAHSNSGTVQQILADGTIGAEVHLPGHSVLPTFDIPVAFGPSNEMYVGYLWNVYRINWSDGSTPAQIASSPSTIVDMKVHGGALYVGQFDWTISKLPI